MTIDIYAGISENGVYYSVSSKMDAYTAEASLTEMEAEAVGTIIDAVGSLADQLRFCRRTDSYLSVVGPEYGDDFLRIKATPRALWFSLDMWGVDGYADDPRFSEVKNKKQRHWKVKLRALDDLGLYADVIKASAEEVLISRKAQAHD